MGVGRRPERGPRLRGRQGPARDRHDPGAELPRRARLRQDAARRPHLRRQQPLRPGGRLQPAWALGHRHRPEDQPRDGDDRSRPGAAALRRHVQPQGQQGLRDELDGPVRLGDRHAHGDRAAADPALPAEQPAARRPPERDRDQPAPQRGLHGERQLRHRLVHRHAPRPRDQDAAGGPGQRRAPGRDTQRARRQPGRAAALRGARGRERARRHRPRPSQEDRLHPDGLEPDRRRRHPATARSSRSRPRTRRGARAAAPGPTRSATARPATSRTPPPRSG